MRLSGKRREILEKDTQKLHDIIDAQKGIIILLGILFTGSGISIFLLAFFLSLVLGKKITGPLSKLEKVMSEIAQGKLDSVIEIKSEDEIGSLARSFDTMRRGIKAYQKQLKEYGKKLEIKVKERTKELEEKNTELERFNRLAVGRELKMIEMKKKISELEGSR